MKLPAVRHASNTEKCKIKIENLNTISVIGLGFYVILFSISKEVPILGKGNAYNIKGKKYENGILYLPIRTIWLNK